MMMSLELHELRPTIAVLKPSGVVMTKEVCGEVNHAVQLLLDSQHYLLVIDLGEVDQIDTWGLSRLVSLHHEFRQRGGRVVVANANHQVQNLFAMSKLALVFEFADSVTTAVRSIKQPSTTR